MDYFDLYYAYLAQCEKENWANMRDPNHDYMEWNHTLPQCIFGDQPIGQWLTKDQHAIVSALQTIAFRENCLCGWHKKFIPGELLELSWSLYLRMAKKNGENWGKSNVGRVFSDESKTKISLAGMGRTPWNKGKLMTNECREKLSLKKLIRWRCLETGFVSSSTGLTKYQTRRNINTSLREKLQWKTSS